MKIVLVNTFGHAGAANSCIRLHMGLRKAGIESFLLLLKDTSSSSVTHKAVCTTKYEIPSSPWWNRKKQPLAVASNIKREILAAVPEKLEWFSFANAGYDITDHEFYKQADIVNLHWVSGFIDYASIKNIAKPIVWTLHDMNPFTGGCHYSGGCDLFVKSCKPCPQLESISDVEATGIDHAYKLHSLSKVNNLSIVTPSNWLTRESKRSSLFGSKLHSTIPYGLDETIFKPGNRQELRTKYKLPQGKKVILFVAYKSLFIKRKGYKELTDAFEDFKGNDVTLLAVGGTGNESQENSNLIDFGFVHGEAQMAELYSLADLFIIPSLEDNLPNTVIESLLCGTPVVGFDTGGIPDMIVDGFNGVLAEEKTANSLLKAIEKALLGISKFDRDDIRNDAKARFNLDVQARSYIDLYSSLLPRK